MDGIFSILDVGSFTFLLASLDPHKKEDSEANMSSVELSLWICRFPFLK